MLKNAIIHLYNSTSTLQREVVFRKSKEEIKQLAVDGAKLVMSLVDGQLDGNIRFEYSPESFTCTEPDYAAEVTNAVLDVFKPSETKQSYRKSSVNYRSCDSKRICRPNRIYVQAP